MDLLIRDKGHRAALDRLKMIAEQSKKFNEMRNTSKTAAAILPGMSFAYAVAHPVVAVTAAVGIYKGAGMWSRPATAKHLAKWTRQIERAKNLPNQRAAVAARKKANKTLARVLSVTYNADVDIIEESLNSEGDYD
jgi:hypothetical protein